jgi:glycosyltransferase involved in cell wall biosynthesis
MKIVYVSDAIYPYNKGGKEKRLFELTTRLAKMGHDVHIYTMHWWDGPEKERMENGVTLHAISKLYPLYTGDRRSIKEGVMFGLACFKLFRVKFDVIDVDHIPVFPIYSSWIVCILRGKKMHTSLMEVWGRKYWVDYMGASGNVAALLEWGSVKLPHTITAISGHTRNLLQEKLGRSRNVHVVACGIDYDYIRAIKPASVKSDIIFAGRLLSNKNVDLILKAVHLLAQKQAGITCTIIGNGPEEDNLKALTQQLKITKNITFINFLPKHDDLYAYIKSSKVFAFPSDREGFGIVVIESIACNTPVVTANVPTNAAKDLISPKTGSLSSLNPADLSSALELWIDSPKKNIANEAKRYNWDALAHEQVEVYTV